MSQKANCLFFYYFWTTKDLLLNINTQVGEKILTTLTCDKTFKTPIPHATVVDLWVGCKVSTRDIVCHLKNTMDYHLSVGSVTNILDAASGKASSINHSYNLSAIKDSAADELYHHNKPLLASIDIPSRFCALLTHADDRDHETWGIHLLDLKDRGYAPEVAILDGAKRLVKGHEVALPETKLRHDHFHCIMDMKNCARFLKNKEASAATEAIKLYQSSVNAKNEEKKKEYSEEFTVALSSCTDAAKIHGAFKTLSSWLPCHNLVVLFLRLL